MPIATRDQDYGGDPIADPRVQFLMMMILVGMFVIAGIGIALQSRGSKGRMMKKALMNPLSAINVRRRGSNCGSMGR
jgi:hypothetical protein